MHASNKENIMKKNLLAIAVVLLAVTGLLAEAFSIRQAFNLRWEGQYLSLADDQKLVFWTDTPSGHRDVFAQKIGSQGQALWTGPRSVVDHENDQVLLSVVNASDGNLILLSGELEIDQIWQLSLQKIDPEGQKLWGPSGITIPAPEHDVGKAMLLPNQVGGAFIIFQDWFQPIVWGQSLSSSGQPLWGQIYQELYSLPLDAFLNIKQVISDGSGGLIVCVDREHAGISATYLTRFSSLGTVFGNNPLVDLDSLPSPLYNIQACPSGDILLYNTEHPVDSEFWQCKIDNGGQIIQAPVFFNLPINNYPQIPPVMKATPDGGSLLCYSFEVGNQQTLYAQKFNPQLQMQWPYPGLEIGSGSVVGFRNLDFCVTASGAAWITWIEGSADIEQELAKAQYISPDGSLPWSVNGLAVGLSAYYHVRPLSIPLSDRGLFLWFNRLNGMDGLNRQVLTSGGNPILPNGGEALISRRAGSAELNECLALDNHYVTVWDDVRDSQKIYYQVLDTNLQALLPEGGQALNPDTTNEEFIRAVAKTPWNSVVIVYINRVSSTVFECYLQEINASGGRVYPGLGIPLPGSIDIDPSSLSFDAGSIYLGWIGYDGVSSFQLWGQRISNGLKQWGEAGRVIVDLPANCFASFDAVQAPYYLWRLEDYNQNEVLCLALKVDQDGNPAPGWDAGGLNLITDTGFYNRSLQHSGHLDEDLVAFIKLDSLNSHTLRAQRISASGTRIWTDSGVSIFTDTNPGTLYDAVYDDQIGFVYDTPEIGHFQLRFQMLSPTGQLLLPQATLLDPDSSQSYIANLLRFEDNSWLCSWSDIDSEGWASDVYARHFAPDGQLLDQEPILICGARYNQDRVQADVIGNQALIAWTDSRCGILNSDEAIYGIWAEAYVSSYVSSDDPEAPIQPPALLHANYPNPFNPSTTISYTISKPGLTSLSIYNLKGQLVKTLLPETMQGSGRYNLSWDGTDTSGMPSASGVYIYRLRHEGRDRSGRMVLMK